MTENDGRKSLRLRGLYKSDGRLGKSNMSRPKPTNYGVMFTDKRL